MKNTLPKATHTDDEMRAEYDFSGGVRGKHYKERLKGYTIEIHKRDGTTTVKQIERSGIIALEADVQAYFPDSQAVNHALRTLIALVSEQHKNNTKRERKALAKSRVKA